MSVAKVASCPQSAGVSGDDTASLTIGETPPLGILVEDHKLQACPPRSTGTLVTYFWRNNLRLRGKISQPAQGWKAGETLIIE